LTDVANVGKLHENAQASPSDLAPSRENEVPPNEFTVENESPVANDSTVQGQSPSNSEAPSESELLVESEHSTDTQPPEEDAAVPDIKLPPELIRQYVANIQPMLLTRCGAANCHGHFSEATFKLHRVPDRHPSRTMTLQNLAATLEQLDEKNATDSPLFTWGQAAHGKMQSKLLAITNVQQQTMLLNWIQDVTAPPSEPKRTPQDALVDRQRAFAEGAERISLRKIKQSDIRWQEPTQRAKDRLRGGEPALRQSTDIDWMLRKHD
jgi:hypothetical protein